MSEKVALTVSCDVCGSPFWANEDNDRRYRPKPEWVDDGLLALRNVTVYVCDGEDTQAHGFDVHLNVGDNQEFEHICFDTTATLYDRSTLGEAWDDAADWLYKTANTLIELRNYIRANDVGHETCAWSEVDRMPLPDGTELLAYETGCGARHTWWPEGTPRFCPSCGRRTEESLKGDA